jgi:hypothetical protein
MKTQLNEELDSIKYLFGYQKGRVISEQNNVLLTEIDGQTKEEYLDCVQQFGDPVKLGDSYYIKGTGEFEGYSFYNNKRVSTPTSGNQDYYCSNGKVAIGKDPNTNKTSSTVKPPSTATNIQNKLLELGKDIGPTGPDGKIGPNTINAIWDTIKDIQK